MSDRYREAVEYIARAVARTLWASHGEGPIYCIANRGAGTRSRRRSIERLVDALRRRGGGVAHPAPQGGGRFELWWTESGEDAYRRIVGRLADPSPTPPVFISMGGDGTHNHALHAAVDARHPGRFLRLPMGSGNDAAGTVRLDDVVGPLPRVASPRRIPAIRVETARDTVYAFNIASVGIDAYVTMLHQRWKRLLPANTYRLMVDLAVLRYDRALDIRPMEVEVTTTNGTVETVGPRVWTLLALGVTGNRTYGDHMRVLPGEENLCAVGKTSVVDKVRMKKRFFAGMHVHEPFVAMYDCRTLTLRYDRRLPLQCDGEPRWLESDDFPVRMTVVEGAVEVLEPVTSASI
ncbi:MAG: hypothetical protein MI724_06365 [Spirochaetales bacterium]|nr:hypothetical protein [Spirochaetales bacterium]